MILIIEVLAIFLDLRLKRCRMSQLDQSREHSGEHDHEQRLQALALTLFDSTTEVHRLPAKTRRLLQLATVFYRRAGELDREHAHRVGRDLALAAPIDDLTPDEQAIVASTVAFQRDKVRPRREPAFLRLDANDRQAVLRLAAILQLADGIDGSPTADLIAAQIDEGRTVLVIRGLENVEDVTRTRGKLWRKVFGQLAIRAGEPGDPGEPIPPFSASEVDEGQRILVDIRIPLAEAGQSLLLSGDEPIAEGARRILRRFFDQLLARERRVLKREDPEDVHQMRVATRRLRAALQVVETVYDPEQMRRYRRGLRRVAGSLGAVRDRDVFLQHLVAYDATLSEAGRAEIEPLLTAIAVERADARARLLDDLAARRYQTFKRVFATFLTTPGADPAIHDEVNATTRVRDFAGSAIWRRYELWRTHALSAANAADETLHAARIAGKRLRYTLEFFADALGPNVERVLTPLIALQDNLGTLQDGVVARAHVDALGLNEDQGAQTYLAARDAERPPLLAELPRLWEKVASATYRRQLFELIVKL